ncbi:MAG: Stealth CR1 domain-containing protein [Rhodoferax sp.]|uniref:Stealth CR1 domain-containing protein n=1 Tax=Rhodoferax sp. TaxID=50421 RepID=UPI0030196E4F
MDHSQPVDIVYLWVDGNDPCWRLKRQLAYEKLSAKQRKTMAVYSNVEGRFRDNDELRYSLRALERYFPAHGHIYIVTDSQAPAWLHAHQQLTVIDHRDLIPAASLPTFDSGHIESYIHRIPNLSERFFYFNDDVFFGAPVKLADWFWKSGVYVGWSDEPVVSNEPLREDATALDNACRLSHQWLSTQLNTQKVPHYTPTFRTFAHSPRPLIKSVLFELESLAPELFAMVRSTVFRTWDKPTIVSDFVLRWSLSQGMAKVRDYVHAHVSTGDKNQPAELSVLKSSLGELDFFCINDTTDNAHPDDPRLSQVRDALQRMFPDPSRFEQAEVVDAF